MSKKLIALIMVIVAIIICIVVFAGGMIQSNDVSIEDISVEYMNYITPTMKQRQAGYDKSMAGKVSFIVIPHKDISNIKSIWLEDIELTYSNGEMDKIDTGNLKYNSGKTKTIDNDMVKYAEELPVGFEPAFTYSYEKPYSSGESSDYYLTHFKAKLMVKIRAEGVKEIGSIDTDIIKK